ncbi:MULTISPECIES: DMT family transporter [Micrococcaceae]|uniref:DMT family transporter n=1 Tax=Micrococcaceae TaxID=1268 RepID=UPI00103609B1|nr:MULTISPECIES: DMT family transporter [Micrococcaceae]TAP27251.1 DMT family transporter [Arthrobacter sp. S41]UXN31138.1 DMT family transporter [Glutamicibacter sp. M10]
MKDNSTATLKTPQPLLGTSAGLIWGIAGVCAFSLTVPFTRIAVSDGGMDPLFVGSGRAVIAAILATAALLLTGQRPPNRTQWARLSVVALGVVAGFPLLTSFALTSVPASHGAVVTAILPAATAVASVLRTKERPRLPFWLAAGLGAVVAVVFAAINGGGIAGLQSADILLIIAVIVCAIGYAEGGLLSRELGSWQTISWALVLACPMMVTLTAISLSNSIPAGGISSWGSFAYLGIVSMFLGFVAWYRGLAIGPMSTVSQVQLAQPVMTMGWAALLLGEHIGWKTLSGGLAVIACALLAVRTRNSDPKSTFLRR